jgi:hypothetical protein
MRDAFVVNNDKILLTSNNQLREFNPTTNTFLAISPATGTGNYYAKIVSESRFVRVSLLSGISYLELYSYENGAATLLSSQTLPAARPATNLFVFGSLGRLIVYQENSNEIRLYNLTSTALSYNKLLGAITGGASASRMRFDAIEIAGLIYFTNHSDTLNRIDIYRLDPANDTPVLISSINRTGVDGAKLHTKDGRLFVAHWQNIETDTIIIDEVAI